MSLTVNRGEVVVLMDPSGSGKSTFIRTFNGLEPYQKGSIEVDGVKISQDLADGMLVEDTTPTEFFNHPKEERTKKFLAQILH